MTMKEFVSNYYKCVKCNHHARIGSHDYYNLIFDDKYNLYFDDLDSFDFLNFTDLKPYNERLETAKMKTNLSEAISVAGEG